MSSGSSGLIPLSLPPADRGVSRARSLSHPAHLPRSTRPDRLQPLPRPLRARRDVRGPGGRCLGSVACGHHAHGLDHEDHRALRRARLVADSSRHRVSLLRTHAHGVRALELITNSPSRTRKNSSSSSCLCQWKSPTITPRRTTASFTLVSVWLNHGSWLAASAAMSITVRCPYLSSRLIS